MTLWLIGALVAPTLHYLLVSQHRGLFTADGLFVLFQTIVACGTLTLLDPRNSLHQEYAAVVTVPLILYCLSSILLFETRPSNVPRGKPSFDVSVSPPRLIYWWIIFLSIGVVVAYFMAVGYNVFLVGLRDILNDTRSDITTLRLEAYSGDRYLAPGYVNQFKNVLLPALVLAVGTYLWKSKHPAALPFSVVFGGVALVGVIGTGQRGAFVTIALIAVTASACMDPGRFRRRALAIGVLAFGVLMLSTALLGRSSQRLARSDGVFEKGQVLAAEIWKRIAADNQLSGIAGFEHTSRLPPAYGREWLESLLGLTPFSRGSALSSEIFASLYGSDRGTSPPSLWGSVHYNFGWLGLLMVPVCIAVLNHWVERRFFAQTHRDLTAIVSYSGIFVVLGTWIAGGPDYLVNAGIVGFALLAFLASKGADRGRGENPAVSGRTRAGTQ